jgi:hypothetical protein
VQGVVLGAEGVSVEVVGVEEVVFVVEGQRPESAYRWQRVGRERDGVPVAAVQALPVCVEVLIEVGRFGGPVHEDVRLAHRGAG